MKKEPMKNYPRFGGDARKPKPNFVEGKGQGKPCTFCGTFTTGIKFIEVNWFRGDDEEVRVCRNCWKKPKLDLIEAYKNELKLAHEKP